MKTIAWAVIFLACAVLVASANLAIIIRMPGIGEGLIPMTGLAGIILGLVSFVMVIIGWVSEPVRPGLPMKAIAGAVVFLAGAVLLGFGFVTSSIMHGVVEIATRLRGHTEDFVVVYIIMGAGALVGLLGFVMFVHGGVTAEGKIEQATGGRESSGEAGPNPPLQQTGGA